MTTIFVNPRQFNAAADFSRYPRDEARDLAICEAEGVDLVWAPPVEEVYVPGLRHAGRASAPSRDHSRARPGPVTSTAW